MPDLNETDRRLLAVLRSNSRLPVTGLAQEAGVSRATAKARLDRLVETGQIRRFTIETDADVGGEVRAVSLIALQGRMSRAVIRTLSKIPEITSIHATNGAWDLVVDIRADTLVSFNRVLRDIREVRGVVNSESCLLLERVTG
ncbi:MAG: Lrp/AsnC family transcriptional regulator [Marinibacterium sp.]